MNSIHLSQARRIMQSPREFSLRFLTAKGEIRDIPRAISLKWDFDTGTRTIKCFPSNQIRRIRDCLILAINDIEIYI
ncbi:MAG: hypothetical protein HDS36_00960 [Bacteroides sp.]|nr:hypothetical protein [Bacteroides sp.]